jgi:hypothetical protein
VRSTEENKAEQVREEDGWRMEEEIPESEEP